MAPGVVYSLAAGFKESELVKLCGFPGWQDVKDLRAGASPAVKVLTSALAVHCLQLWVSAAPSNNAGVFRRAPDAHLLLLAGAEVRYREPSCITALC